MPQNDRHRTRIVPIEFEENELLESLPPSERLTLVFITNGNANIILNKKTWSAAAPCVLCISQSDRIAVLNKHNLQAKSFSFNPVFINSSLTFDALTANKFIHMEDEHDRNILMMFLKRSDLYSGIIKVPSSMYLRINEWMNIIGAETFAQSDGRWTCRIRRYLLQTLYLIDDIYMEMKESGFTSDACTPKEHAELALEYIHTNYQNDISLENLCSLVNLNRTSLNRRFKEKTGHTAMNYLINHRIKIACETLVHTNLKLTELSVACGFKHDSYFIKQFTKKMGISPSEFRQNRWEQQKG